MFSINANAYDILIVYMIHIQEIGHLGQVVSVLDSGDIRVLYCGDKTFIINPHALTKVSGHEIFIVQVNVDNGWIILHKLADVFL